MHPAKTAFVTIIAVSTFCRCLAADLVANVSHDMGNWRQEISRNSLRIAPGNAPSTRRDPVDKAVPGAQVAAANLLINGDFEKGSGPMPEGWRIEGSTSKVNVQWEDVGGINGSRSVRIINLATGNQPWVGICQTVQLQPYTAYLLRGFIKASGLSSPGKSAPAVAFAVNSQMGMMKGLTKDTSYLDWTPFQMDFVTGPSPSADVKAVFNKSSGAVWFTNLTLEKNAEVETFESKHFVIHFYKDQIERATRVGIKAQMANIDSMIEAYHDLTNYWPQNEPKQSAWGPKYWKPGPLGYAGNPLIYNREACMASLDNWKRPEYASEIFLHEVGHNFCSYALFDGHFNEFLMAYALDTLNLAIAEDGWRQGAATRNRWEVRTAKQRATGKLDSTVIVYKNLLIRDKVGWEPFKKLYRYVLPMPDRPTGHTNWEQFKLWHDKLSEISGFDAWSVYTPNEKKVLEFLLSPHPEPEYLAKIRDATSTTYLSEVKWDDARVGRGNLEYDYATSMEDRLHLHSLPAAAPSSYTYHIDGRWNRLVGSCGVLKGTKGKGKAAFIVRGDGRELFHFDPASSSEEDNLREHGFSVNTIGVKVLEFVVDDDGHADCAWFDPQLSR